MSKLRHKAGLSQQQLATRAKVNAVQVKGIETGARRATIETLLKLSWALDLHSLDELFEESFLPRLKSRS